MLNLATIGTSWICSDFISAARKTKKYNLFAVYSRDEENAKKFAKENGGAKSYTDLDEMAQCEDIDVVYIASPNALHFEQTLLFLKNKKHVICEKPIFSNIAELEAAFECAEENGVFLFEAIRNVFDPNLKILREELKTIGNVQTVFLNFSQYSSKYPAYESGAEPNVFSLKYAGGALVDLGVYPIFTAVSLFGEPMNAHYIAKKLRTGVDGSGTLVLEYEDFNCTIFISKISPTQLPSEIQGDKGTVTFVDPARYSDMKVYDHGQRSIRAVETDTTECSMRFEAEAFSAWINNRDIESYNQLRDLSRIVLSITEKSRRQNAIIYSNEV